jgi:hypothetical protein
MMHEVFQLGFRGIVWNFTEAGHGKGIPNGIGGVIKRSADKHVQYGKDITCAADLIATLQNRTSIQLYEISEAEI